MFRNVIAGIDGTEGGRDAIALAQALAAGRITLVTAYPAERARGRGAVTGYFELLRDDALRTLEQTRAETGVDADLVACPDRSPARALQHVAAERHADLVVVGSAHHGPVARLLLGDVGRGVLHGAPCPVAVAPRGFRARAGDVRRIAAGFDDSDESRAALAVAAELAEERNGTLAVHSAWDMTPPVYVSGLAYSPDFEQLVDAEHRHVTAAVDAALADLPRAERRVTRGRACDVLVQAGRDADVLVVGSRGWGQARRIALGSTSDHLVHHAPCPVIVVPRPAALAAPPADPAGPATTSAAR